MKSRRFARGAGAVVALLAGAFVTRAAHADDVVVNERKTADVQASDSKASESKLVTRAASELSMYQDSTATTVITPALTGSVSSPTEGWSVGGSYLVDIVSAASPDIISTASRRWEEVRNAGSLAGTYKPGATGVGADAEVSSTPDYLSLNAGANLQQDFDNKNLTMLLGYHYGHDVIGRTGTSFSVFSHQLDTSIFTLSGSRVINPSTVFTLTADMFVERGDQSKPYRYIPLFSPEVAPLIPRGASAGLVALERSQLKPLEQLPLGRERYALTGRVAIRTNNRSTLRLEERAYMDSWGQPASTTDFRYMVDVSRRIRLWPHLRANVQGAVSFWQRAYVTSGTGDVPALRTGDRELGGLATGTAGFGIRYAFGPYTDLDAWALSFTFDLAYTDFFDALYITDRTSGLGSFMLERVF